MSRNVNDIILKYRPKNQDTFETPSLLSLSETDISGITEDEFSKEQAFSQIKRQKDRVLELLVNYQKELTKEHSDFKKLKGQLNSDASQINSDYGTVLEDLRRNGIVPGMDTIVVMNVIEEFVARFSGLREVNRFRKPSAPIQPCSTLPITSKIVDQNSAATINAPQQLPQRLQIVKQQPVVQVNQLENELSTFLQISNISHMNFSLQDDTFYKASSVPQIRLRLQGKIERLKQRLEKILSREQLVNTRKILQESIDDLNSILANNDLRDIKRIVYKLEQTITKISEHNFQSSDTVNLYKLLQKAIRFSKKKEKLNSCVSIIEEKQESQVSQTSTSSHYTQIPTNAFMKKTEKTEQSRVESVFVVPQSNTINSQALQTQFLHLCLKIKGQLPLNHSGRKILIFSLFDKAQELQIPQDSWQSWVTQELTQA